MTTFHSRNVFLEALEDSANASTYEIQPMDGFQRLPPELLPIILGQLRYRQGELSRACLVCKEWARVSKPLIWEWVRSRDSSRMEKAFSALSESPELCSYVKELEVRVYPLALHEKLDELQEQVLATVKHTKNLKSLVWTRKGSLRAEVLDAIFQLEQLEKLELNATPDGGWRAEQLLAMPSRLRALSLLLPDRETISYVLPRWIAQQKPGQSRNLQSLSIICLESPVVNPARLADLTPGFSALTSFTLHGCTRLADEDVLRALKSCGRLQHVALEAVNISSDFYSKAALLLPYLESLRTSHPGRKSNTVEAYYAGLSALAQACPRFKSFTHYLSGDTERGMHPQVSHSFVEELVRSCGDRLVRFEISGLSMALESVREICLGARKVEQLVLPVAMQDLDDLQFCLLGLHELRSLHLVSPSTTAMRASLQVMLEVVKHCSSTLKQIGFQNRVRSIGREVERGQAYIWEEEDDPAGPFFVRDGIRVSLDKWDEPLGVWPEALLVVRT